MATAMATGDCPRSLPSDEVTCPRPRAAAPPAHGGTALEGPYFSGNPKILAELDARRRCGTAVAMGGNIAGKSRDVAEVLVMKFSIIRRLQAVSIVAAVLTVGSVVMPDTCKSPNVKVVKDKSQAMIDERRANRPSVF